MKRGTPDHPKTAELMTRLGVTRYEAVGLLELLWHFTVKFAPQGDIGKWADSAIASGCSWGGGEPEKFVRALTDSGWLDVSEKHRLIVHHWSEHADDATKKALARKGLSFVAADRTLSGKRRTKPDNGGQKLPAVAVPLPSHAMPEPAPVTATDNERQGSPPLTPPNGNGNGNGVPEDQRPAYAEEVWTEFLRVSDQRVTRIMSPGEFVVLKGWMDSGVPLRIILRAMADTRGKGSSLGYYGPSVKAAIESWRQAVPS